MEKGSIAWTGKVRGSLVRLDNRDGKFLAEKLTAQSIGGRLYPLDEQESRKLTTHTVTRTDKVVTVSVSDDIGAIGLEGCQVGYKQGMTGQPYPQDGAQTHHIALCLVAYLIVERERLAQHCTWRQLKRRLILRGSRVPLPALERLRAAA